MRIASSRPEAFHQVEAVAVFQGDVDDRQVRPGAVKKGQGARDILSLAADLQVAVRGNLSGQPVTHNRMVIDDKDAGRFGAASGSLVRHARHLW